MAIISNTIEGLLNYRIQQEEQSSRKYRGMAVWLEFNGSLSKIGMTAASNTVANRTRKPTQTPEIILIKSFFSHP